MLDPSNLTRRKAYKTRVKGIWRCVENVSINCPFFLNKLATHVPSQPIIQNPDSCRNFSRKFTLQTWQSWHFLTWTMQSYWGWRREAKMDQKWLLLLQNYLKQVVPPSSSSLLFSVFYRCLCQTYPWTGWNKQIMTFFHESIFFKL